MTEKNEKKSVCLVDGFSLVPPLTGVGRSTLELCRRLFGGFGFFTPLYYYGYYSSRLMDDVSNEYAPASLVRSRIAETVRSVPFLKRAVRKALRIYGTWKAQKADLYWEPNHVVLEQLQAKHILVTVHDLSCLLYPEWHPKERLDFFGAYFGKGIQRADLVVTDTAYIRHEVLEYLHLSEDRVSCIPCGVDHNLFYPMDKEETESFRRLKNLPERFVLCVGSIEPRKNLLRLLEAWKRLPSRVTSGRELLLIGEKGWENDAIKRVLQEEKGHVRWLGYVPVADLPYYYNLAELFVYPSLYEGFGLPPLEAIACGTPVLLSDIAVHREVCGDVPLYVTPNDTDEIAQALEAALSCSHNPIPLMERAALYDWSKSAAAYEKKMSDMLN